MKKYSSQFVNSKYCLTFEVLELTNDQKQQDYENQQKQLRRRTRIGRNVHQPTPLVG